MFNMACLRTPNAENPVQEQVRPTQTVYETNILKYQKLVDKFPNVDYLTLDSIYVSGLDGDNNNPGTEIAPLKTIQTAINKAKKGTIIRVKEGNYYEFLRFAVNGTKDEPIVLFSEDGPSMAKLNGNSKDKIIINFRRQKYIIIDGFEIQNTKNIGINFEPNTNDQLFKSKNRYVIIRNCKIHDTGGDAIKVRESDYLMFENNEIFRSTNYNGTLEQLVDMTAVFHAVIRFNLLRKNKGSIGFTKGGSANIYWVGNHFKNFTGSEFGVEVGGRTTPGYFRDKDSFNNPEAFKVIFFNNLFQNIKKESMIFIGAQNIDILHNTFYNCSYDFSPDSESHSFSEIFRPNELPNKNIKFIGNLIYNDEDHPFQKVFKSTDDEMVNINFHRNLFYSENPKILSSQFTNPGGKGNNFVAEPVFTDLENGDFTLQPNSPGIDCNKERIAEITFDYNNNQRKINDGNIDCGAFENP
jgi:hypothetical protein